MAAQFKARNRALEPVREPQWLGTIPHAATSKSSSNGSERFRPTGESSLRSTHLLARSVADPSVISPTLSPPGRRFECPTALTRPSEFAAPGDRTVTDDASRKTARAREHSMYQRIFMQLLCDFCGSF